MENQFEQISSRARRIRRGRFPKKSTTEGKTIEERTKNLNFKESQSRSKRINSYIFLKEDQKRNENTKMKTPELLNEFKKPGSDRSIFLWRWS